MSDEILLKIATQSLALAQKNKMYGTITFHLEGGKLTRKETKQSERLEVPRVPVHPGVDPYHLPKLHQIFNVCDVDGTNKKCYQVVEVRGALIIINPIAGNSFLNVPTDTIYCSHFKASHLDAIKERFTGARCVELAE